eukprot:Blabericola_migrator_1__2869@NODE_1821_length_3738_cov_58_560610_g1169_i0_p2_GENE_NODE_1821_length_3738_cov_58_560610_g1169_i0NODE_1821_length_3738_cov_58_560610_g1169_i0_p2_ORF_typecomplete_len276_score67_29BCIP/PF13862_6/2_1e20WW_1/PF18507_1/0_084_NODE_1821_length_3738_cov_58_560610_g1169_i022733100
MPRKALLPCWRPPIKELLCELLLENGKPLFFGMGTKRKRDDTSDEQVDIDFEVMEPSEEYEQGIRLQLAKMCQVLGGDPFDLSAVVVDQVNVGNVICIKDEPLSDSQKPSADNERVVVGCCTILNFNQYKDQLAAVVDKLQKLTKQMTQRSLNKGEWGLLIVEGMANIPPSLWVMCCQAILDDIKWTEEQDDCPSDELINWRNLQHLILVVMSYEDAEGMTPVQYKRGAFDNNIVGLGSCLSTVSLESTRECIERALILHVTIDDLKKVAALHLD